MTLVDIPGGDCWWYPGIAPFVRGQINTKFGTLLDAVGHEMGVVTEVPARLDGKTLTKLATNIIGVNHAGSEDAEMRLEGVDLTTGFNDGTLVETNSNKVQAVSATGINEFTLTDSHVVSTNERLAALLTVPSGSSADFSLAEFENLVDIGPGGRKGYFWEETGAGQTKHKSALGDRTGSWLFGFSDDSWWSPFNTPWEDSGNAGFQTDGTVEVGVKFQLPWKVKIGGIQVKMTFDETSAQLILGNSSYSPGDTGATRLSNQTIDQDVSLNGGFGTYTYVLETPTILEADTDYYVTLRADGTTVSRLYYGMVNDANHRNATLRSNWSLVQDDGAGGWTETTTSVPEISLGIVQLDDGAGGGGGSSTSSEAGTIPIFYGD